MKQTEQITNLSYRLRKLLEEWIGRALQEEEKMIAASYALEIITGEAA